MTESVFIAGDWGTTHLRLYLCSHSRNMPPTILASQMGPGVSQISDDFEQVFFDLAGDWLREA